MKLNTSKHVIQIFNNSYTYLKNEKSFNDRKHKAKWDKNISSKIGYVENQTLFISENDVRFLPISGNSIFLIDQNTSQKKEDGYYAVSDILSSNCLWEILRFKQKETIEIHLVWEYFQLGYPQRESFKLSNLEINKPIEIKINGKRDGTGSSRGERVFIEKNYIIVYLGEILAIERIGDENFPTLKKIPKHRKLINLLKNIR